MSFDDLIWTYVELLFVIFVVDTVVESGDEEEENHEYAEYPLVLFPLF